ncbi:hypothetical protein [Cryptosporidium parvum Iowa II]|uniref:Virulence factor SKSR1 n=2 Tax=Cryptosporidium parvum TaxID=5807 RepID=SKSR1_CRYPI|nr:hypothetical protein [Cryptosporidium parvum Iowa II]EAK88534.1 conserved hypothetical protein [Cryptosporidium parvum Iowa II]QOY43617.1 putative Secreted Protein (CpLSP gene family) [Cryptosporidium parvum]WKS75910.1 hypothetical protein CPCDC_1g140 [Cryptosporidium sp. 43IA8]WRK30403.1 putative Secreted Protein (CpLSP gene family) [Cryptosporidium parvum]|eukprot:QOY43617.1 hypothetical protein CPATCC_000422 [Cryptosporidium parvum]
MKFDTKVSLFVLFSLSLFSVLSSANIPNDDGEDNPKNVEKSIINKFSGLNLNVFEAEFCIEILIQMMLIIYTFILRCNAVFNPEESIESVSKLKLILLYIDKHSRFSDKKKMISPSRLKGINEALKYLIETDLMYQMENSSKLDASIFVVLSERLNEITSTLEILSELLKLMIIKKVHFGYNVIAKKMISFLSKYRLLLKRSFDLYKKMSKSKFLQQYETTKEVVCTISINLAHGINLLEPVEKLLDNYNKKLILQNSTGVKTSGSNRSSEKKKNDSNERNKQKLSKNSELSEYTFKIEVMINFSFEAILFAIENFFFFKNGIAKKSLLKHFEVYDKIQQEMFARSTELLLTEEKAYEIKVKVRQFLDFDSLLQTDNSVFSFNGPLNKRTIIEKFTKLVERLKILLLYLKQEIIGKSSSSYEYFLLHNTIIYLEETTLDLESAIVLFERYEIDHLLKFLNRNSMEFLASARKSMVESSTSKGLHTSKKMKPGRFKNIESVCATSSVPINENDQVDLTSKATGSSKTKKSKSMRKQLKMELLLSQEEASEKKSAISETIKEQKMSNQKQSKRDKILNRAEKWKKKREKEEDERRKEREEEAKKKKEKEEKVELCRLVRVVTKIEQNFEAVNEEIQMRESLQSLFLNVFNLLSHLTESENTRNDREKSLNQIFEGGTLASASLEENKPSQPPVATQSTTSFVGRSKVGKRRADETHKKPLAASTLDLIAKSRTTNESSGGRSLSFSIDSGETKSLETTQAESGDKLRSKSKEHSKTHSHSRSRSTRSRTGSRGRSKSRSKSRSRRGRSRSRRGRSRSRSRSGSSGRKSEHNFDYESGYSFEIPLTEAEDIDSTKNIESKLLKLFSSFESNTSEDSTQTEKSKEQFLFSFFGIKRFDYSKITSETSTSELETAISDISCELERIYKDVIPLLTGEDYEIVKNFEKFMIKELIKLLIMLNNVSEKYK